MSQDQSNQEQMLEFKIFNNQNTLNEKNNQIIEKFYNLKKKMH